MIVPVLQRYDRGPGQPGPAYPVPDKRPGGV